MAKIVEWKVENWKDVLFGMPKWVCGKNIDVIIVGIFIALFLTFFSSNSFWLNYQYLFKWIYGRYPKHYEWLWVWDVIDNFKLVFAYLGGYIHYYIKQKYKPIPEVKSADSSQS